MTKISKLPKVPKINVFYQFKICWKAGKPGSWEAGQLLYNAIYELVTG